MERPKRRYSTGYGYVCQVDVRVKDDCFVVRAEHDLAAKLAGMDRGTVVRIKGPLRVKEWKNGQSDTHRRTVLEIETIEAI